MIKYFSIPFRLTFFYPQLRHADVRVLDVGCGNRSPSKTKRYLERATYHGIDREDYNNDSSELALMDRYFTLDLEDPAALDQVPDGDYDLIFMSHVLEHLSDGLEVLRRLSHKLKCGGQIYVEFPSVRSLALPSMAGTLNFCDDPTHLKVYDLKEVANALLSQGCRIVRAGRRRHWRWIAAFPVILLVKRRTPAVAFWDLLGFADFCLAQRQPLPA